MPLFDKLKSLLNAEQAQKNDATNVLQLANAVLLVEISHADFETDPRELKAAAKRLAQRYELTDADADTLLNTALAEHEQSVSLHDYLTVINDNMDQDEKAGLIEDLWSIAYSDDKLDCHEEHQVRKIADLLHVPHVRFIQARHHARNS